MHAEPGPAQNVRVLEGDGSPVASVNGSERWIVTACAVLLGAAFLLPYHTTVGKLTRYWASNDMYSYGFLVPFISGYLIWLRRDVLAAVSRRPNFVLGVPLLAGALLLFVVGTVSSTNLLEELSLPLTVCALVLLVGGTRMTRALLFPLAFLMTMVPFWDFLTNRLHLPFQLYSATIGVWGLQMLGIPVYRSGIFIHLPNITLEVADLCSGVNHLVAVLCIGVPITQLFIKRWRVRVGILTTAIVIALLSNGLRVGTVALFAYYGIRGPNGDIHGPFAVFRSLAISAVGFVVLFWLVSKFSDTPVTPAKMTVTPPAIPPYGSPVRRTLTSGVAVALALALLLGTTAFTRSHAVDPVALTSTLATFPNAIGAWTLSNNPRPFSPLVASAGFDQALSRSYTAADGTELDLLLGYFEHQGQGRELVGYKTDRLIAAGEAAVGAWAQGQTRMADFVTKTGSATYHVTYSYLFDDRTTAAAYEAKWWTTWRSLVARKNNGAIVVIRTRLHGDEPIEVSRARVRDFVEGVTVAARRYLPSTPDRRGRT